MRRQPRISSILPAVALCWLAGGAASAQESADDASSVVESQNTPKVLVMGFEATSDQECNPLLARYGRCVEEVRFVDHEALWKPESTDVARAEVARWINTGELYATIWEDLAYRWQVEGDPIEMFLKAEGVESLPAVKQQWESSARNSKGAAKGVFSMPRATSWLNRELWVDPRVDQSPRSMSVSDYVAQTTAFFPLARVHKPDGLVDSKPIVVAKGRFAVNNAAGGKLHPYDIMDADPESSSPLFEQMYPYQRGLTIDEKIEGLSGDESDIPLNRFFVPETLKTAAPEEVEDVRIQEFADLILPEAEFYGTMHGWANEEFSRFYELVGVQILRFAREEYTSTHLRVLSALMAMKEPPRAGTGGDFGDVDPNAGTVGQTDLLDEVRYDPAQFATGDFKLNHWELPYDLIEKHLDDFAEWRQPSEDFKNALLGKLILAAEDSLKVSVLTSYGDERNYFAFGALDDKGITDWVQQASVPGQKKVVEKALKRVALGLLLDRMDEVEREERETYILLDHMAEGIIETFGGTQSPLKTPAEMEDATRGVWESSLSMHGLFPAELPDHKGAIDPLAICTTAQRRAALEEASFGKINVDQLVVAPVALTDNPVAVLEHVAQDVPFIMMDDPEMLSPEVTPLVRLPGDRAIYRLRWQVWSGWHLLWGVEPLSATGDAGSRMALRASAICEDTVLMSPDLVPTVVRASMLDGDFRPAVPVRNPGKAQADLASTESNDRMVADSSKAVQDAESAKSEVDDFVQGDEISKLTTAAGVLGGLKLGGNRRQGGVDFAEVNSVVGYFQDIVHTPIRKLREDRPLMVMVFDHSYPGEHRPVWDYMPATPYFNEQVKTGDGNFIRSSGWAVDMRPVDDEEQSMAMVSPAYMPTELLATSEARQAWKRQVTSDWYLSGGLGVFPLRSIDYSCIASEENLSQSISWCDESRSYKGQGDGFVLDMQALNTRWLVNDRRFGIEFGPEVRLELLRGGYNLIPLSDGTGQTVDTQFDTSYSWSLLTQVGMVAGVRFAPGPGGLHRRGRSGFPWGAPEPDGSVRLNRVHWGLRTGFLVGFSDEGTMGTGLLEGWTAFSMRRKQGAQASFTPYHPAMWIGPYARFQGSFGLTNAENAYSRLNYSLSAMVGIRMMFRLAGSPTLPEVETKE